MGILLPVFYGITFLGISFDLLKYNPRYDLVYGNLRNKAVMEETNELYAMYKIINSPKDVRDFFKVDPRLALRSKLFGSNSIVTSIVNSAVTSRETDVQIMINCRYIRAIEKIPSNQQVQEGWKSKKPDVVGTHYVSSFSRGGQFITSIIFSCRTAEEKEKVMKAVVDNLEDSGTIDESFVGKIRKIKQELGEDYVDYHVGPMYCRGCNSLDVNGLEQIVNFSLGLPESVKRFGNGYGNTLTMELEDLSTISDFPVYQENSKVIAKLDELDQMFDDVVIARDEFRNTRFLDNLPNEEDEKEVYKFDDKLKECRKVIGSAVINLDISPSASLDQFDEAYEAYGSTDDLQKYQREFRVLRDKMKKKIST